MWKGERRSMSTPVVEDRLDNTALPTLSGAQILPPKATANPKEPNHKSAALRLSTSSLQIIQSPAELNAAKHKRGKLEDLVIIQSQNSRTDVAGARSVDDVSNNSRLGETASVKLDGLKALPRLSDSNFNFWKVSGKDYIGNGLLGPSSRRTEHNFDGQRSVADNTYQSARNSLNTTHTGKFRSTGLGYLDIGQFEGTNTSNFYKVPQRESRTGPGSIKGALSAQPIQTTSPLMTLENTTSSSWGVKLAKSEALHYETATRKLESLQHQYCASVNKAKGTYKSNRFSDPTAMGRYLVGFCEELGEQIRSNNTLPLARTFKVLECLFEQGVAFTEALAELRLEMQLQKEKSKQQQLQEAEAEEAKANVEVGLESSSLKRSRNTCSTCRLASRNSKLSKKLTTATIG